MRESLTYVNRSVLNETYILKSGRYLLAYDLLKYKDKYKVHITIVTNNVMTINPYVLFYNSDTDYFYSGGLTNYVSIAHNDNYRYISIGTVRTAAGNINFINPYILIDFNQI